MITQLLALRKGRLENMVNHGTGWIRMEHLVPARGLIGFRTEFLTETRGTGQLHHVFEAYEPWHGELRTRPTGSLVADREGVSTTFTLLTLQERGSMFVGPGEDVYEGMIVGENARAEDIDVNPTKEKKLTNMRQANSEEFTRLIPKRTLLEQALEFIREDESVEVTPNHVRLRKVTLPQHERAKAARRAAGRSVGERCAPNASWSPSRSWLRRCSSRRPPGALRPGSPGAVRMRPPARWASAIRITRGSATVATTCSTTTSRSGTDPDEPPPRRCDDHGPDHAEPELLQPGSGGLTVRAITVNGETATWSRTHHELIITPSAPLASGADLSVVVTYEGPKGFVILLKAPCPGSSGPPTGDHRRGTEAATAWFLVNDHPSDRASYTFRITVPTGFQVVANGVREPMDTGELDDPRVAGT